MSILNAQEIDRFKAGRSFSWPNIAFRLLWICVWTLLAAWTPPQLHFWRRVILRLFGSKIGKGAKIYSSARIWYPPHLKMEAYSVLGPQAICYNMASIEIGERAVISQYAYLCCGTHNIDDAHFQLYAKPIVIHRFAWVAARAFVGPGVTLGEGAVLGACAVTFKDIEAWSIAVGNPAQEVRKRKNFSL